MSSTKTGATRQLFLIDRERRREEVDWMLSAIAGALVTSKLPPNDAFAWARIAAQEAQRLETSAGAGER
jgi:hypothetical protein